MGHDYVFDRSCAGCAIECDADRYYMCASSNYCFYEAEKVKEKPSKKSKALAPKASYKAFEFTGRPSTIAEELNKFFKENSNVELVSMVKVDGYCGEASGVLIVVKEK